MHNFLKGKNYSLFLLNCFYLKEYFINIESYSTDTLDLDNKLINELLEETDFIEESNETFFFFYCFDYYLTINNTLLTLFIRYVSIFFFYSYFVFYNYIFLIIFLINYIFYKKLKKIYKKIE